MNKFIKKPSAAMIVAGLALFFALSGGAFAATQLLPSNSVGTQQLKNGSVSNAKLQDASVSNAKLQDASVSNAKLQDASVGNWKLQDNSVGTQKVADGAVTLAKLSPFVQGQLAQAATPGPQGPKGDTGATGAAGATGAQGTQGTQGPKGDTGETGASSPYVYSYSGSTGPDSSRCGGNWATDTFDATYTLTEQADGSWLVDKLVKGTFVTIAGSPEPNPASCAGSSQAGGVNGTFVGTEVFVVGAGPANFDPTATCDACVTSTSSGSASEAQNTAFVNAVFPDENYDNSNEHFDFTYRSGGQTWTDSDTSDNGTGNISG